MRRVNMQLNDLFARLWKQYVNDNFEAQKIYDLFVKNNEHVVNDHVAFRTFDDERVNVVKLGSFFEDLGYKKCGEYDFPVKKLYARHYEHSTEENRPKIFISEIKSKEFSPFLQQTMQQCVDAIEDQVLNKVELLYSGIHWHDLDYSVYQKLLAESEYAAWLYVFGFRANHFTVFVNKLKNFTTIKAVNDLLKQNGFTLNVSGGEIKGTPEELLEQSSTMASKVIVNFKQGEYEVLNSYYEFAKRYTQDDGKLYQGFIAKSADKIFESTNIL